ncbi:MAG: purine-nucleoside phosphorylase [Coriobacteriales bacterium]|jgi:purine-nucleoside phosphorylase|nr:purine-nucleoside phosphorylase [Coriobacteriales bacterium]
MTDEHVADLAQSGIVFDDAGLVPIAERVRKAVEYIDEQLRTAAATEHFSPRIALITGSGLSKLAQSIDVVVSLDYAAIPYFPRTGMRGHPGKLLFGVLSGQQVVCFQGRLHTYEGHSALMTAFPVLVARVLGAQTVIITNAAGAINTEFDVGQIMLINDHINLSGQNPIHFNDVWGLGDVFKASREANRAAFNIDAAHTSTVPNLDMTFAYTPALRETALQVAAEEGIILQQGVYVGVRGASFETPAEIRAFRILGADAVGMSSVHETTTAVYLGMHVLGLSLLTNMAAGTTKAAISPDDIMNISTASTAMLTTLVERVIARHLSPIL